MVPIVLAVMDALYKNDDAEDAAPVKETTESTDGREAGDQRYDEQQFTKGTRNLLDGFFLFAGRIEMAISTRCAPAC